MEIAQGLNRFKDFEADENAENETDQKNIIDTFKNLCYLIKDGNFLKEGRYYGKSILHIN